MSTVARYVSGLMLVRILAVGLVLVALLQVMDLVDSVGEVLERRGAVADLVVYVAYRLPSIIESVIPIAVLLGTITVFLALAGRSELDAMRSAGLSQGDLVRLCLPVCLLFAGLHFVLADRVVPASQQAFVAWWDQDAVADRLWLRGAESIVAVTARSPDGARLDGLTIYARDAEGRLTARTEAAMARYNGGSWTLFDAEETRFGASAGTDVTRHETLPWLGGPEPEMIGMLEQTPERLPIGRLSGVITGPWSGATEAASYRTELALRYAAPLATIVMLLLASPAMRRQGRSSAALIGGLVGLSLGLSFLVAGGILAALGRAGLVPPAVAAWLPVIGFAIVGVVLMRRSET